MGKITTCLQDEFGEKILGDFAIRQVRLTQEPNLDRVEGDKHEQDHLTVFTRGNAQVLVKCPDCPESKENDSWTNDFSFNGKGMVLVERDNLHTIINRNPSPEEVRLVLKDLSREELVERIVQHESGPVEFLCIFQIKDEDKGKSKEEIMGNSAGTKHG